jgi:NAD(P)-dependent dehydrogenase (short-subunit alcohol dehydrogenase family)
MPAAGESKAVTTRMWSLASKTCVITGATGSIGFAIARRFAQEGARLVFVGRDEVKLADALGRIQTVTPWQQEPEGDGKQLHGEHVVAAQGQQPGPGHLTVCLSQASDISQYDTWKTVIAGSIRRHGLVSP